MPEPAVYNSQYSMQQSRDLNNSAYSFDRNMSRNPDNVITIFTVNSRMQFSTSGHVAFVGKEPGERFRKVASIDDPKYFVDDLSVEGQKNQKKVTADDAKWVAMDWLNPQNVYSLDQNFVVPNAVEDGTNLLARGLFFIVRPFDAINGNVHDQPTDAEVAPAEKRLRDRYTGLVRLYQTTSSASPAKLPQILSEEMVDALNFAGLKTPYNTSLKAMVECPTCGENIAAGVKFHKSESLGVICINPSTEGWKAAVAAGIKTRDDVPEEFRWAGRSPNPR